MSSNLQPASDPKAEAPAIPNWVAPSCIGAIGVVALLGLVFLGGRSDFEATKPAAPAAQSAVTKPPAPQGPGFDTVRVDAGGNAVIAGHAKPGASVTIIANGKPIGTAKADKTGNFVFVTSKPLAAGGQQLALSVSGKSGAVQTSARNVTVSVPEAPNEGALAVLGGGAGEPSQVLSGQGPHPGTLGIGSVDYDGKGNAVIAGTAKPGADVSLYLDGSKLGTATAGSNGRWTLHTIHLPSRPGTFKLETTTKTGAVTGSMQTAYAPRAAHALAPGHVMVARGQCLWLIARKLYGRGMDYTLIYRANEASIRDPNLIYPGQRLALPKQAAASSG